MPRSLSTFRLTALLALAAGAAHAQAPDPAASPAADTKSSPVFTPAAADEPLPVVHLPPPEDDHGDPRRIQSSELSHAVVSTLPKYDPVKPAEAPPANPEADKPRNGIVRLPKVTVRDRKEPVFTDQQFMTEKAKKDLALKQYVADPTGANGFVAGSERVLFQSYADQQYADAERASNISSLRSDASVSAAGGDKAESDFIKQQSNDTYMRHGDWSDTIPTNRPDAATPR